MAAALAFGSLEEKRRNAVRASCFAGDGFSNLALKREKLCLQRVGDAGLGTSDLFFRLLPTIQRLNPFLRWNGEAESEYLYRSQK